MRFVQKSTVLLFVLWVCVVPPGCIYLYAHYGPENIEWGIALLFVIFSILTIYFPIRLNDTSLFLVMWVTLPAFLLCGLFMEMLIMQIAVIAFLFNSKSIKEIPSRFFYNSLLFFILSIVSAGAFHLVGGTIGSMAFWPLIGTVFCYQVVHIFFKQSLCNLVGTKIGINPIVMENNVWFNYGKVVGLVPLSLTLYFLLQSVGNGAFLLIGAPYFFVAYLSRIHNNTNQIKVALHRAAKIGQKLSGTFEKDKVIDQFISEVACLFSADYVYLFKHEESWLEISRTYEKDKFSDMYLLPFIPGRAVANESILSKKPEIYSKKEAWANVSKSDLYEDVESVLAMPFLRQEKAEAVLVLASKKRNAFKKYHLQILDLLCSYFTVSLERAHDMQKVVAKSERCGLTNLYNYEFLEKTLAQEMERLQKREMEDLSVVLIDIDYFKSINDTYGHQSGNDVLYMFAQQLRQLLPENGVVCRYGGEEFVYLLPDTPKQEALVFAEKVRAHIEHHTFSIISDLGDERLPYDVQITVSIGVATAFEDGDEANELLRNADRSLYLGAKRAGRNRVAGYVR